MSIQQSINQVVNANNVVSLAKAKAKVKKASKVLRVVQFNDLLTTQIHNSVVLISNIDTKVQATLETVAKRFDKILKSVSYDDFVKVQSVFKTDYMAYRKVDDLAANNAWSRIAKYMTVKKPKSESKDAQRVAKSRGAKGVKAKTSSDNRVTPLSVKLQELKATALKRDIYSVKAMGHLNFAIQAFEVCEAEAVADTKVKAKPKAKTSAK